MCTLGCLEFKGHHHGNMHPFIPVLSPSFLYHPYIPSFKSKDFSFTKSILHSRMCVLLVGWFSNCNDDTITIGTTRFRLTHLANSSWGVEIPVRPAPSVCNTLQIIMCYCTMQNKSSHKILPASQKKCPVPLRLH